MCGIFGTSIKYKESDVFERKLQTMHQRGPDYSTYFEVGQGIVFGHNRLAIVDLDSRSNQPFVYEHVSIVFNGEIYNFLELKDDLLKKGYSFKTTSDTEVVCAAFLEYGQDCVNYLNGMFAFVIYDPTKNILFGARDRMGKKPFYYHLSEEGFEFASKLSALEIGNDFELDNESLTKYLYWNYIPEPKTPYKKVYKLPSATAFTYDLGNKIFHTSLYWDLPKVNDIKYTSFDKAKEDLKVLLQDAVDRRMIADVPLGIFLSGGIDSSLVAAMAQKNSAQPVKTFSVKFNEKGFDESVYAKEVATKLGTNHTEIECSYSEGIELIKNFSDYYDEPFADSSAIPTLLLSKHTKKEVTVALSGDGGDETFMGYNIYDIILRRSKIYNIPFFLRTSMSFFLTKLPFYRAKLIGKALKLKDVRALYLSFYNTLNTDWVLETEQDPSYVDYLMNPRKDLLEAISDFDTKTFLNGDCITKVERASMAFSLEVRSPLLDYRIVEFARKIPTNYKYSDFGSKKHILKEVLYDYLPKEIFDRKKTGFSMPLGIWFRGVLKEYVLEVLTKENIEKLKIINYEPFKELLNDHMEGKWDHTPRIWKVLILINWLNSRKKYI
ncbi:asparagine synthase (glutamine-hydrolyzing) [Pedobacter sp.]|uniref:asparagine synthase (glutamine-hydrolyzing) n=1 Tax=Pedobacter sp. TaxID=1411316 RepID=UPI003BAB74D0